jgi:hypothetical protein
MCHHGVRNGDLHSRRPRPDPWCRKELAHIRCEHTDGVRLGENLHRGRKETEAESIAHLVCRALGLDTQVYSDAYVLGWANGDMDLVKDCAQTILRAAKAILADLTPAAGSVDPAPDLETSPHGLTEATMLDSPDPAPDPQPREPHTQPTRPGR